jgi:hypothetical protein
MTLSIILSNLKLDIKEKNLLLKKSIMLIKMKMKWKMKMDCK